MMAFLLFLIVFVINYNNGMARPATDSDVQIVTRNGIYNKEDKNIEDRIINLPTVIKPGLKLTIKGQLHTTDKLFQIVFHDNQKPGRDYKILYDYANIALYENESELESVQYGIENLQENAEMDFTLIITWRIDGPVAVIFDVGVTGPSNALIFEMDNKENIKSIETQGATHIDSLLFKFL